MQDVWRPRSILKARRSTACCKTPPGEQLASLDPVMAASHEEREEVEEMCLAGEQSWRSCRGFQYSMPSSLNVVQTTSSPNTDTELLGTRCMPRADIDSVVRHAQIRVRRHAHP